MSNHLGGTNKKVSETPRTEAEVNRQKCWSDDLVTIDANFACQLERELNAANQRIKRLEEAGNEMHRYITVTRGLLPECTNDWRKAKEAKP
jgi:hypothetical protein